MTILGHPFLFELWLAIEGALLRNLQTENPIPYKYCPTQ
jgi:hypothetical protein